MAAVAAILGSGLLILMALAMLLAALVPRPQADAPPYLKVVSFVMCFVILAFAGWGITTSVGLFRMRNWSRRSVLVFSSLLVFMGGSSAVMIAFIPMPATPEVSAEIMAGIKIGIAVFYGILALIGGFWLFYFNTARVKASFGPGALTDGPGGRPLSVSIIAWFLLIGGAFCIAGGFLPFPAMVFGLVFTGWVARAFYLVFAAIEIWIGVGLLRLNPLSRLIAMTIFGFGILNSVLFAVLPEPTGRIRAMLESMPYVVQQPAGYNSAPSTLVGVIMGSLVSIIPIWFLIARRPAFTKPPDLPRP